MSVSRKRRCRICRVPADVLGPHLLNLDMIDDGKGEVVNGQCVPSPVAVDESALAIAAICVHCLRGLKRIPWSVIERAEAAWVPWAASRPFASGQDLDF